MIVFIPYRWIRPIQRRE